MRPTSRYLPVTCLWARAAAVPTPPARTSSAIPSPSSTATSGTRAILSNRRLTGVLVVTCVFFFLYGPVEVALPIHIAQEIHGSAALLGTFWATFGIGAIVGGLPAGLLRRQPLWRIV